MTLAEKREMGMVRDGLIYVNGDHHSPEPHWHSKYPWAEDPASLPNNKRVVEATFHRTEKQLVKEPEWKMAYASQVHEMGHDEAAGTLLRMQKKAWVIRVRIIAQKVVDKCVVCKKIKARTCQQLMGDLPEERLTPAALFQFTSVDLFGPYQVTDDVKRRVKV